MGNTLSPAIAHDETVDTSEYTSSSPLLDLPWELRETIYIMLARITTLRLKKEDTSVSTELKITSPPLLVCWQMRKEYLPILLGNARVLASVRNFNFDYIDTWTKSLTLADCEAFAINERLKIVLFFRARKRGQEEKLTVRWLKHRRRVHNSLSLPWSYEVRDGSSWQAMLEAELALNKISLTMQNPRETPVAAIAMALRRRLKDHPDRQEAVARAARIGRPYSRYDVVAEHRAEMRRQARAHEGVD